MSIAVRKLDVANFAYGLGVVGFGIHLRVVTHLLPSHFVTLKNFPFVVSWTGMAVTLSVTLTVWFPNVLVVVFGCAAVAGDAAVGWVRLSVITTRGFVLVVVGWAVVVVVGCVCAPTSPYENNTQPTNVPRLKSRLNVIIYLI
jgi:hypothetical protein